MRPKLQKQSALKLAGRNETQTLKAKRIKACKSNYPIAKGYWKLSRKAEGRRPVVQIHINIVGLKKDNDCAQGFRNRRIC